MRVADDCQTFLTSFASRSVGKPAKNSGPRFVIAWRRKAVRISSAFALKYPLGIVGQTSLSPRRKRPMSLRYSPNKLRVSYSGCPWKWTKRLLFCRFTKQSTPASMDLARTEYPQFARAPSGTPFHLAWGVLKTDGRPRVNG